MTKFNGGDDFELVDHSSWDGDSVSNLSYVEVKCKGKKVEVHNGEVSKAEEKEEPNCRRQAFTTAAAVHPTASAAKVELRGGSLQSEEAGTKVKEESKLPAPRLIRIELNDDEIDCGIGVYWCPLIKHYVGMLRMDSAAYRAGVSIGDRICFVNKVATKGLNNSRVVDLLIRAGKNFDLLILQDPLGLYSELGIPVSLTMSNIVNGAGPAAGAPIPFKLVKRTVTAEYGFEMHKLVGTRIESVDANGAEYRAGLREGWTVAGVGDTLLHQNSPSRRVEKLLKDQPISSTLWIARTEKLIEDPFQPLSATSAYLITTVFLDVCLSFVRVGPLTNEDGWSLMAFCFVLISNAVAIFALAFKVCPRFIFVKLFCSFVWLCYLGNVLCTDPTIISAVIVALRFISVVGDVLIYKNFMRVKNDIPLFAEARALKKEIENEKKTIREYVV